ncbi:unnamed protein product [Bursaphelenchus xylophilus]|uniref:(pine wood nematode) hypothetical protein n=1 Tax=Bursaphelenchus xylophilus TaxID=6326 RepID=A0A1I7SWB4_BURXY|nr:unnamed protein product [Bursaphelenchus xylophilus]CAG9099136.1 unnamed protein product [Bursaphelenchus xylophilus]
MERPLALVFLTLQIFRCQGAYNNLDNSVIGSPIVRCEKEYIHFSVPTKKPFNGRVYVKGENQNPHCVKIYGAEEGQDGDTRRHSEEERSNNLRNDFSEKNGGLPELEENQWHHFLKGGKPALDSPRRAAQDRQRSSSDCPLVCPPPVDCSRKRRDLSYRAELDVQLDSCNTIRDRVVNPPGVHISFVVVVSFHNSFVTKLDRAYRIQCAYEESDRTVTTKLDVSMPQTVELSNEMSAPKCEYVIKSRNKNTASSVQVGDILDHEWSCLSSTGAINQQEMGKMFGMLVHDCYIEDGQGQKALAVDSHGCSVDTYILPTPKYDQTKLAASVSAMVVKFPDKELMTIQCAISVCMKELGKCDEVTPPKCGKELRRVKRKADLEDGWVLSSPQLTVLDPDTNITSSDEWSTFLESRELSLPQTFELSEFCLSIKGFGFLIASMTFIATITLAMILSAFLLRPQGKC